jgi:hypothetical protein
MCIYVKEGARLELRYRRMRRGHEKARKFGRGVTR